MAPRRANQTSGPAPTAYDTQSRAGRHGPPCISDALIAAHLRQAPELSDDNIAARIRGLDDPARVARVRGLLAAGHDPDTTEGWAAPAQIARQAPQATPGPRVAPEPLPAVSGAHGPSAATVTTRLTPRCYVCEAPIAPDCGWPMLCGHCRAAHGWTPEGAG